jgi:hypothetical protein
MTEFEESGSVGYRLLEEHELLGIIHTGVNNKILLSAYIWSPTERL